MLFGLFGRKRSLKEINAELLKLSSNRDSFNPQVLPQINIGINIKIAILEVLKWYLKDKTAPSLSYNNDTLKKTEEVIKKSMAEQPKK